MRSTSFVLLSVAVVVGAALGQAPAPRAPATPAPPAAAMPANGVAKPNPDAKKTLVQVAILLDTSNSMDGLIEQAKTELWRIVNEVAKVKVDGVAPEVQVALYHYGSPALGQETGYIKQLVPLSDDLDKVSDELFKLRTSGGDEYCGMVIQKAVEELKWTNEPSVYKMIFIAGNEPFTQGPVKYQDACKEAAAKGIVINTIFCGNEQEGISTGWKDGSVIADGSFSFIEQNNRVARAAAPQDKQLSELSAKLNDTYVPYGQQGRLGAMNQQAQDSNAARAGSAIGNEAAIAADRAITKGNQSYKNSTWDLVDAVNEKRVNLKDIKAEELPEEMRKLDEKGREEYLAKKEKERDDLRAQIKKLSDERDKYLAALPQAQGVRGAAGGAGGRGGGGGGFGGAVIGGAGRGR